MKNRVRFAPSPTGNLHIGSVRTALFNWVFAKKSNADLILRIEDTDQERSKPEYEANILEGLEWLGLDFNEGPHVGGAYGPYRQSERMVEGLYTKVAEDLLAKGLAYYAFETAEELDQERLEAEAKGVPYVYSRKSLALSPEEVRQKLASGIPSVIRFRIPDHRGAVITNDLIRGSVSFEADLLGDFVILKSDGAPTYNFAVVVDDVAMKITHVIRGEDHISNTPRQILVYEALGEKAPEFAHLPIILGPDRSKLSKRHGAQSVSEYRDQGYMPDALVNYLSLLGWSPKDTREVLSRAELTSIFEIHQISKSGAIFDIEKLNWMNAQYIRQLTPFELSDWVMPFMEASHKAIFTSKYTSEQQLAILELIKDSLTTLPNINQEISLFTDSFDHYLDQFNHLEPGHLPMEVIRRFRDWVSQIRAEVYEADIDAVIDEILVETKLPKGKVMRPIRMACTGRVSGPLLPRVLSLLGRDCLLERLKRF
jgi:nondiscriminating glutamyl-tRNA synthetase